MLVLALALACGSPPAEVPVDAKPVAKLGLDLAKPLPPGMHGSKAVKIEFLLTGDPSLIGVVVDAGDQWIDPGSGGMVLDDDGKPIAKPDITQNVRSIALRNAETVPSVAEKADPNVVGNTLRKVHAYGTYRGCEFNGAGATMCYLDLDVTAPAAVVAPTAPGGAWVVPSASLPPAPDKPKEVAPPAP